MRNIISFLLLMWLLVPYRTMAAVISRERAAEIAAETFSRGVAGRSIITGLAYQWNSHDLFPSGRSGGDDSPTFHVFAQSSGRGFVIISGEDRSRLVLGYSPEAELPDLHALPDNFVQWMKDVDRGIRDLRKEPESISRVVENTASDIGTDRILLQTAMWNQHEPYNLQCPMDGDNRSVTGCTATALAIVMRYYSWPLTGKGSTEAYTSRVTGIHVPARSLEHDYGWDNMPLVYSSSGYTMEQAEAVSELLADIGASIKANYSAGSTSAAVHREVLYNNFGYNPGVYWDDRDNYTEKGWRNRLINELNLRRPVFYSASSIEEGHAFVIDGYTSTNYFHINWGWGGYCDGYFPIDGFGTEELLYNLGQCALFDFVPDTGYGQKYKLVPASVGVSTDDTVFEKGRPVTVKIGVINRGSQNFDGEYALAVTDAAGNVKEWVGKSAKVTVRYDFYHETRITATFTCDILAGDRLRAFAKADGSDEWELVRSMSDMIPWEILLAGEDDIRQSTSVRFERRTRIMTVTFKKGVTPVLLDGDNVVSEGISVTDNEMSIDCTRMPAEIYTIRLTKGAERVEFQVSLKSF